MVVYFENCLRLRIAGQILRLPSDCICAALTLYHRYRRAHSGDTHEQRMLAACLFCASKLEEVTVPFRFSSIGTCVLRPNAARRIC